VLGAGALEFRSEAVSELLLIDSPEE